MRTSLALLTGLSALLAAPVAAAEPDAPRFSRHVEAVFSRLGCNGGTVARTPVVDGLSHGYRPIVPEECVADKHESPHFANLYDVALKYADVLPVAEILEHLRK